MHLSSEDHRLSLTAAPPALTCFNPLLQEGIELAVDVGCTVRELLCRRLGIDGGYVDQRIQTAFLDGKPVDRLDQAGVRDGSTLALSAALPGLLGATLRKSGAYASLRGGITHAEPSARSHRGRGRITLKVFNVLLPELSPIVFHRGVHVSWGRLGDRIRRCGAGLISAVQAAELDGKPLSPKDLADLPWNADTRILFLILLPKKQVPIMTPLPNAP